MQSRSRWIRRCSVSAAVMVGVLVFAGIAWADKEKIQLQLKPDAPADQVERIGEAVNALAAQLPEVRSMAVGRDLALRDGNASFGIAAQFDDVEGFKVYADHPEHVRIVTELIGPFIESRSPVQFTA